MTDKFPAPWTLNGNGYMFLCRFSRDFIESSGFLPPSLQGCFAGGFGCVMIVDYRTSTAGPYRELLFIPGKFRHPTGRLYSITKIYVSSKISVDNGRENWGIPKELADFSISRKDPSGEVIRVSSSSGEILSAEIGSGSLSFPVTTRLAPVMLVQELGGRIYHTRFQGHGKGRFARLNNISVNSSLFPDISRIKPLVGIRVENFTLEFPVPKIITPS